MQKYKFLKILILLLSIISGYFLINSVIGDGKYLGDLKKLFNAEQRQFIKT